MDVNIFRKNIKEYLEKINGSEIKILYLGPLGCEEPNDDDLKEFNYGKTLLIRFLIRGKQVENIISTMKKNIFGHQHFYDRAKSLLLDHSCFNKLPRHVKSIDVGAFMDSTAFKSLGDASEFFILREVVDGKEYYHDLEKIKKRGVKEIDINRTKELANYLVKIHKVKNEEASLYKRRIRELIGDGECIMGLTDSYPKKLDFTSYQELKEIEKKCVEWRYRIKDKTYRLCQVHGDYHPWNILFRNGLDFSVIDRSRGEWGEPADDVASITINYLFYSLQKLGKIDGEFLELFNIFWNTYLKKTEDLEMLSVIAPFYAWRGLVLASPIWYPDIETRIRVKIFNFIKNILNEESLNLESVPSLFEEGDDL
ncbi:MAG: phosphotransferase [Candidatus Lokiarchaeota archaeon]|nr:phosphotransferase [Candidatus Lokiarchaeota archaeon]